jgi:4-alpha-glucanotransferase
MMRSPRASGILLHPTSLPSPYGIGDIGPDAFSFVDFLKDAGQRYWQMLPLGPTGYGDSPYQCLSSFAGNTLLVSPEVLVVDGLLSDEEVEKLRAEPGERVDFAEAHRLKGNALAIAAKRFAGSRSAELKEDLEKFVGDNSWWLDDYALFRAIKTSQGERPWYEWPEPLKLRENGALSAIRHQLEFNVESEKIAQFLFYRQWFRLKKYASENGVAVIGDMPIFVALDSSDVWCNRDKFKLNRDGTPRVVAGVPPDYFSETGQLWGNPIYDWERMASDDFGWWVARVAFALKVSDVVRIDHFRGLAAAWEVPGTDETAENGEWVPVPGDAIFDAIRSALGHVPLIAEDLGVITDDVIQLREKYGFPGMRILQYAFGGDANSGDLPHNFDRNTVVYTGTHDNDTTIGWWRSLGQGAVSSPERDFCSRYLDTDAAEINWDLIRAAWASVVDTAIAPVQDILGLDSEARMNTPATTEGNWAWRMDPEAPSVEIKERLYDLTVVYGRTDWPDPEVTAPDIIEDPGEKRPGDILGLQQT